MADELFRRALRGYEPEQVDAVLRERDQRIAQLEAEAGELARRVSEQEKRLRAALGGEGGFGEASPGAIGALGRRIEEIHAQARSQATRMRMKALQDAVQMSDRVTELAKLRDELGARVEELAGKAGIRLGAEERPAIGTAPSRRGAGGEGVYLGEVEVEVGPLEDFAQLAGFQDAAESIGAAARISMRGFAAGRATLAIELTEPTELIAELRRLVPFGFNVRDAGTDVLVLDVESAPQQRAA